jgi:sterol 3beta-glucosyltransferase
VARRAVVRSAAANRLVPFSTLVGLCRLVIHHGGAGVTDAAIRAGLPSIVIPHFADQPVNAWSVVRAGLGRALHPQRVTGERLDHAFDSLASDGVARLASEVKAPVTGVSGASVIADEVEGFG